MSNKKKTLEFYEYYPSLFQYYFPSVDSETIKVLCEAGHEYYLSVLYLDAIIDNQELHRIFSVLDLQESTIKKLSTI